MIAKVTASAKHVHCFIGQEQHSQTLFLIGGQGVYYDTLNHALGFKPRHLDVTQYLHGAATYNPRVARYRIYRPMQRRSLTLPLVIRIISKEGHLHYH